MMSDVPLGFWEEWKEALTGVPVAGLTAASSGEVLQG